MALILSYLRLIERLRKKKGSTHLLVKLDDAVNRKIPYECVCGRGGEIYLGRAFARWMMYIVLFIPMGASLFNIKEMWPLILFFLAIIAWVYIPGYFQIYKQMKKSKHSMHCSRKAAIASLPYQTEGSWFEIRKIRNHKKR